MKHEDVVKSHNDAAASHAKNMEALTAEHKDALKSHSNATASHVRELEKLKQEYAISIATLDSNNVAHQNALEELKSTHAKNLDEAHDRAITAGHSAHALELEQLQASHADAVAALKKEHAASQATSQAASVSDAKKYQVCWLIIQYKTS